MFLKHIVVDSDHPVPYSFTMMQRLIALILLLVTLPFLIAIYLVVKMTSDGPFIYSQRRAGKNKKPFTMYKIRTMHRGAEKQKKSLLPLNERSGPVFKIHDDPRFTPVGKILSHTGLDELPQLINIIKGEMAFVGPRPLPVAEADQVPIKYHSRFSILPGITSHWVVQGPDQLTFDEWMKLDMLHTINRSRIQKMVICMQTVRLVMRKIISSISS